MLVSAKASKFRFARSLTRESSHTESQSKQKNGLPGTTCNTNNTYDVASYRRLCGEFWLSPSTNFGFKRGNNHCLGSVFIWYSCKGPTKANFNTQVVRNILMKAALPIMATSFNKFNMSPAPTDSLNSLTRIRVEAWLKLICLESTNP